jgi:hypothetical protein
VPASWLDAGEFLDLWRRIEEPKTSRTAAG